MVDDQADTRIFSPLAVAGLCVTIGRYVYLSKRLTAVPVGRFYRFVHIVTYSSGKVVGKVDVQVTVCDRTRRSAGCLSTIGNRRKIPNRFHRSCVVSNLTPVVQALQ